MEPIRRLSRKDNEWQWGEEQETAFREVQSLVLLRLTVRARPPV